MAIGTVLGIIVCLAVFALWPSRRRHPKEVCENCGLDLDREPPCDYCGWAP